MLPPLPVPSIPLPFSEPSRYVRANSQASTAECFPACPERGLERLPVVATLNELEEDALVEILTTPKNALVKQYAKLFQMEGADLEVRPQALLAIAKKALKRKTGARGLRSIIEQTLLDTMFDLPGSQNVSKVVVDENSINGDGRPILIYSEAPKVASAQ